VLVREWEYRCRAHSGPRRLPQFMRFGPHAKPQHAAHGVRGSQLRWLSTNWHEPQGAQYWKLELKATPILGFERPETLASSHPHETLEKAGKQAVTKALGRNAKSSRMGARVKKLLESNKGTPLSMIGPRRR